jgi:hypothetical protein
MTRQGLGSGSSARGSFAESRPSVASLVEEDPTKFDVIRAEKVADGTRLLKKDQFEKFDTVTCGGLGLVERARYPAG